MAWAEPLPSGKGYRGRYRVGTSVRTVEGAFTRKRDAEAAAFDKEDEQRRPNAVDPRGGRMTWSQWCDQHWWQRRRVEDSTRVRDVSRLEHHLRPKWGHRPLDSITRDEVEGWVFDLERVVPTPSTVARVFHLFSASMKAAVQARRLDASPCIGIQLPRPPLPDENYLTEEEVDRLEWAMPNKLYGMLIQLGAYTGLRWSELVALHWQRVHLGAAPRVDVHLKWDMRNLVYGQPKDHERRSVPLPTWLAEELEAHAQLYPPAERCVKEHPAKLRSPCRSGLVLAGRHGGPLDYQSWYKRVWRPACTLAKVQATPHDLRHTAASLAVQRGVPIEQVSRMLGHASVNTTRRYAHWAPDNDEALRAAFARPGRGKSRPVELRAVDEARTGQAARG